MQAITSNFMTSKKELMTSWNDFMVLEIVAQMLQDQLERVKEDIMNPCQNNCQHGCCNLEKNVDLKRGENRGHILNAKKISQCLNAQRNILDYDKLENYRSSRTFFDKEFSMNFMKFQLLWLLQML